MAFSSFLPLLSVGGGHLYRRKKRPKVSAFYRKTDKKGAPASQNTKIGPQLSLRTDCFAVLDFAGRKTYSTGTTVPW